MMQKLNDIPDKTPFKVPENYFEEVNRKIISASTVSDSGVRRITFYNRFRTSLLIAASVTGLVLISYTAIKLLTPVKTDSQVSVVLHDMDPDAYINDIDISSIEEDASLLVLSDEGPEVSKSDIIDYLLSENIEINDIYEHF